MSKQLDQLFFSRENSIKMQWSIQYPNVSKEDAVHVAAFKAKGIPMWPIIPGGVQKFKEIMVAIRDVDPVAAGFAEQYYQLALLVMAQEDYDVSSLVRPIRPTYAAAAAPAIAPTVATPAPVPVGPVIAADPNDVRAKALEGYKEVDGKIVVVVDINKFKADVLSLTSKINRGDLVKSIVKQSAEQDLFMVIKEMLNVEESYDLIGVLAARLLLSKDERESMDVHLGSVTVLKNRAGKLSNGLVRLGGFMGLASVDKEPKLASAVKWIKNPILGEDVVDRAITQRADENEDNFEKRKKKHESQWVVFKTIMTQMKGYKGQYDALSPEIKNKMREKVLFWTVG